MLSLLTAMALASQAVDTAHVVIVATTDVHGHATDWDYVRDRPFPGGLARVATVVDSLRARYPGQVIVADAGDLLQGNAFAAYFGRVSPREHNPIVEAMNLTGYDVATPGNHDFDWGVAAMRRSIAGARFPYVSGNIYTLAGDTLLYPAHVVLRRQGVRVGITGFTTPGVMVWNRDAVRGHVRVDRIPPAAVRALETLRREADVSVVLAHSGMDGPASYDTTGVGGEHVAAALAGLRARPALVVVGHSHRELRSQATGGVHFVQPRPYAASVSVAHLSLKREGRRWRLEEIRSELISTERVAPSPRVVQQLARAHAAVLAWVQTPIGRALGPMSAAAARAEPTSITNFVNHVQRRRSGADLSATAAFNVTAGFDSGTIRMANLVGLYPYENTLKAVRITGPQLKEYLEHSARYFQADAVDRISINDSVPGYNYDIVAGASYEIDLSRPVGDRILNLVVRGRPVRPTDSFSLALNSYRQTGAGGYSMIRGAPVVYDKGENIRDLLADEIRSRDGLDPADYADRHWRIRPEGAALAVRAVFGLSAPALPKEARDTIVLRVLATTDIHGALLPKVLPDGRRVGGLAAIKGMMDSLAAECECASLRLDAGDQMQGTFISNASAGRATVDVLNRVGIDAAAIGNHEFDWSVDTLRRRISEARYAWLAANVFDSVTGRRPEWATPYRILQAGGQRVAIVGYVTAEAKEAVKAEWGAGLRFGEGILPLRDVLTELRAQKPDLTILLAHAGAECERTICQGEIIRLAETAEPRSLDLIVAGHTHEIVNTRISGVPIVEAGVKGEALAVADLVKTAAGGREVRTRVLPVSPDSVTEDRAIAELIERYNRSADSLTRRVVASIKMPLVRSGGQYRLGHLIAEARRNVLRADFGFVINGGIRADLPGGPVTWGQLFEVQPFQNRLLKLTLTGAQFRDMLEHALGPDGRPSAHVAGARVRYDPRRPPGRRIRNIELPGGKALRPDDTYTVATDDFVATGGDGYDMLVRLPAAPAGILDVDALIAYLRRLPQPVEVAAQPGFLPTRP